MVAYIFLKLLIFLDCINDNIHIRRTSLMLFQDHILNIFRIFPELRLQKQTNINNEHC